MSNLRELGIQGTTDCHTHSGTLDYYNMFTKNIPYTQSVDDLMLKAKLAGIDNVVTFPFPSSSYWNIKFLVEKGEWVPSGYSDFPYQSENEILLRACKVNGGPIFPFLCIDPKTKQQEQIDYLINLWDQGKFFGLKHHSLATNTKVSDLTKSGFGDFMAERDIPLIVHTSYLDPFSNPHFALDFAKEFPTVRLSIAHLGWLDETVLQKVKESENLFTDCSTILQITDFFKSGKFLLSTPNRLVPNNPAQSGRFTNEMPEINFFSPKQLKKLYFDAGLSVVYETGFPTAIYPSYQETQTHGTSERLENLLSSKKKFKQILEIEKSLIVKYGEELRSRGNNIFIVGRKF